MKARNRPPRLDDAPRAAEKTAAAAPAPTPTEMLVRARIAGKSAKPGASEVRHRVERLDIDPDDAWSAISAVFGATPADAVIDPARTDRAARVAAMRIGAVARQGGRIAFASAHPGSLLGLHTGLARLAHAAGAEVYDADDSGPFRVDGRAGRFIRWVDGVAVVTDGASLLATTGHDAADEWLFLVGRPSLAVADGPFAVAAAAAGIEVVAFAGLDRVDLAIPAVHTKGCLVVPVHTDRPARAYTPLGALLETDFAATSEGRDPEL